MHSLKNCDLIISDTVLDVIQRKVEHPMYRDSQQVAASSAPLQAVWELSWPGTLRWLEDLKWGRYGKDYERWMYHDVSMCHSLSVVFGGNHLVLGQLGSVIHPLKSALPLETLPEWNTPNISRTTPASGNMSAVRANLSMENQWNKSHEGQPWCDWWPTKCFDAYDILSSIVLTCFDVIWEYDVWTEFQESPKGMTQW